MYKYIYIIIPTLFSKVKLGCWSGTVSDLKSRYKTYYGEFELYLFQCDNNRSDERFLLKYFQNYKWKGELYESIIIEEFMKIANDITYNYCKVRIWRMNTRRLNII